MRGGRAADGVFDASPNAYMILDRDLRYVAANRTYLAVTARSSEELIGRRLTELFPHDRDNPDNDNTRRLVASFQRVFETGQPDVLALIHYRIAVDGHEVDRYWSATHTPLFDDEGRVEFVLQHTTDVTELEQHRRRSESAGMLSRTRVVEERNAALSDNIALLQRALGGAPGFMCFLRGPEHVFEIANDAYQELVGRGRPLIGRRLRDALPEVGPRYFEVLDRVLRTGVAYQGRAERLTLTPDPDGAPREVVLDFVYQPIADAEGRTLGVFVLGNDITRQHHAERESERLTRWLTDAFLQAPVALAILRGRDHVIEVVNARGCELLGRRREDLVHRELYEAIPDLRDGTSALLDRVWTTREPYIGVEQPYDLERDGRRDRLYFTFVCQPLIDPDGNVDSIIAVGLDVTREVTARREVETARAELEAIFDSFPEALYVGDRAGVVRANPRAKEMLGYGSIDDVKRPMRELTRVAEPRDPASGAIIADDELPFARALRGLVTRRELRLRRADGQDDRYVFASGAPIVVAGAPVGAVVTHIDLTELKRNEQEVAKLARVLDATHDFVGIAELDGVPTFINAAGLALVGLPSMAAAVQMRVVDFFVEAERDRVRTEVLPAAIRDNHWSGELTFLHTQTGEHIPVLYSVFTIRDPGSAVVALATITRDLRAQKAAEAERARLLDAERTARELAERANLTKDQFLATVSHELRTPLTAILGWMQMLRAGLVAADKQGHVLETVERNARIQAQLIDDLLDVSRILSGKLDLDLEVVDIAAVVTAAVDTVRPAADARSIQIASTIASTGPLLGDVRRLQQVIWNLLTNAVKFTPHGGRVDVVIERREDKLVITVRDTGRGIPREFLPHVFERFRQAESGSNRNHGGLGLGLSIVRHVVTAHRGDVRAYSDGIGTGAQFVVTLPIAAARLTGGRGQLERIAPPAALAARRVVLVDDEDDTREYVGALLREAGVDVTITATADAALAAVHEVRPDVLLSDLAMPGTDGFELVRRLRALPEERGGRTPAIALTAFARAEDRTVALRAGFQNHVAKPVDPAELFAVIVAVLPPR